MTLAAAAYSQPPNNRFDRSNHFDILQYRPLLPFLSFPRCVDSSPWRVFQHDTLLPPRSSCIPDISLPYSRNAPLCSAFVPVKPLGFQPFQRLKCSPSYPRPSNTFSLVEKSIAADRNLSPVAGRVVGGDGRVVGGDCRVVGGDEEHVNSADLRELERFASNFKSRRIRLGFTQTNVGKVNQDFLFI